MWRGVVSFFFLFKLIVFMYWLAKITSTLHFRIKIFIRTATFQRVLRSCFDVVLVSDFSELASSVGSSPFLAVKRKICIREIKIKLRHSRTVGF